VSEQELNAKVEELKKNLKDAQALVKAWDPGKREDASLTMSSQSLSALYGGTALKQS